MKRPIIAAMPPKAAGKEKEVSAKIVEAFRRFDLNGDGLITKDELGEVLRRLDPKTWTNSRLDKLFKGADVDKDGKLSYDEFTKWLMSTPASDASRKAVMEAAAKAEKEGSKEAKDSPMKDKAVVTKATPVAVDDKLLDTIFSWYDVDQDGQVERVEMLDGEEKRQGRLEFGPSQRKQVIAWFKDAGAEGTPTAGMFLSKEKWKAAFLQSASTAAEDPTKVEAWIKEHYAVCLEVKAIPARPKDDEPKGDGPAPPREPPQYPITIPFVELKSAIAEAASFGKTILVLSSGLGEVETFLEYQICSTVDCKQLIGELFVKKSHSKEEEQVVVRKKIEQAMNSSGFCKPLHIRMANTAFDWSGFCCDKVPAEVFQKKMTVERAHELRFFDDGHKFTLGVDDRWDGFYIVVTSTFDPAAANEHLGKALPFYEGMATIIVDPKSIEK